MTIKAILPNGLIQPTEPLPPEWAEGKELIIDDAGADDAADVQEWARELQAAAAQVPADEHDRFRNALDEVERQSKDAVRREWGLP